MARRVPGERESQAGRSSPTRDVDAWHCEGLKDGDRARTEKPK